jgi:hypothetical protein
MADELLPYVVSTGSLTRALQKIQTAATPDRFTIEFMESKLGMKGGSARPVIPFLKRTGFLASDGAPTDLYRRFRNNRERGLAAADALRIGYSPLFEANESAHDLADPDLRGLVMQMTGVDEGSRTLTAMLGSFKALREHADFTVVLGNQSEAIDQNDENLEEGRSASVGLARDSSGVTGLNIGYTINLHLPATSDIAVFNAIFRSLRENLLR